MYIIVYFYRLLLGSIKSDNQNTMAIIEHNREDDKQKEQFKVLNEYIVKIRKKTAQSKTKKCRIGVRAHCTDAFLEKNPEKRVKQLLGTLRATKEQKKENAKLFLEFLKSLQEYFDSHPKKDNRGGVPTIARTLYDLSYDDQVDNLEMFLDSL